jgi:hypothetical protein
MSPKLKEDAAAHSAVTLELAEKECALHMEGMAEAAVEMSKLALIVKAYKLDDPNSPSGDNVKTVHFVRHGQGFHNLMADLAKAEGREWVQVSLVISFCLCHIGQHKLQLLTIWFFFSFPSEVHENPGKSLLHARNPGRTLNRKGSTAGTQIAA